MGKRDIGKTRNDPRILNYSLDELEHATDA